MAQGTNKTKKMGDMAQVIRKLYEKDLIKTTQKLKKKKGRFGIPGNKVYIFIGVLVAVGCGAFIVSFNQIITFQEKTNSARGAVEAELQRRNNLFNNLVTLYKSYMNLEKDIFRHVADVRSDLTNATKLVEELKSNKSIISEGLNNKVANMDSSLAKLLAVVEQYPQLRASETHNLLVEKLVKTEDRIASSRETYNEMVRMYNNMIAHLPYRYMAWIFGFERGKYYATKDNVGIPPKLDKKF
ncbi:hypothetical protein LCGC14_2268280 [marine sediment metagenome]|uniref:LemA family protein n=1 Tax=marine sediment metagenome TaxID=412755 RepID=A0A0F9FA16_9ZZZZ|nr:LemA family protein [Candidatus Scalindua sediminis]HDY67709.1 LemA family protein [Candidatus Scalindua sp.]